MAWSSARKASSSLKWRRNDRLKRGGDAEFPFAVRESPQDAGDDGLKLDAAPGMALWIEEYLAMRHVLGSGLCQVRAGQVVKVRLFPQDVHAQVIKVQKLLQISKSVGCPKFRDISCKPPRPSCEWQFHCDRPV